MMNALGSAVKTFLVRLLRSKKFGTKSPTRQLAGNAQIRILFNCICLKLMKDA